VALEEAIAGLFYAPLHAIVL